MTPNETPVPVEDSQMQTISAVLVAVARLEGKVDNLALSLRTHDSAIEKQEARLASLERWRAYMIGAAVASGAASGMLIDKVIG